MKTLSLFFFTVDINKIETVLIVIYFNLHATCVDPSIEVKKHFEWSDGLTKDTTLCPESKLARMKTVLYW